MAAVSRASEPAWPGDVLATRPQEGVERLAVAVWSLPRIQRLRSEVEPIFLDSKAGRLAAGPPTMRGAIDEMLFGLIQRTVAAGDPETPLVLTDQSPPHDWFGFATPGSRTVGNNPDNIYRRIDVTAAQRYEIRGRIRAPMPREVTLEVNTDQARQTQWERDGSIVFNFADLTTAADGSFVITVDTQPANGRTNHLQIRQGAERMTIRDTLCDWSVENPVYMEVRRLDRRVTPRPPGVERIADRIEADFKAFALSWVQFGDQVFLGRPPNTARPPVRGQEPTGLGTKLTTRGNYDLKDDEALVIRADPLGASYMCLAMQNCWMQTAEFRSRTGSLNNTQATPDPDGAYTFVVSSADPGVHNWADTEGYLQGTMQIRWQGFPAGPQTLGENSVRITKIRLSELSAVLPQDTRRITSAERVAQLAARAAAYDRRYPRRA